MRRVVTVGAAGIAALLVLNVAGIARFPGGPLREWKDGGVLWLDVRPSDWGSSGDFNAPEAEWAQANADYEYTSALATNDWPWAVEVERITPMTTSGDLAVAETRLIRPDRAEDSVLNAVGPLTPDQQAIIDADFAPLPGSVGTGAVGKRFAITFHETRPGPAGWDTLAVDYRVGPFSFRVVQHTALRLCVGATVAERTCDQAP